MARAQMLKGIARFHATGAFDAGGGEGQAYEGATTGRRLASWGVSSAGPNTAIAGSFRTLRARSREAERNNPWAKRAIDSWVANLIGTGIQPIWNIPGEPELSKMLSEKFLRWTDESDADGRTDFYGQQAIACRTVITAGEVLARLRARRLADALTVPMQIQLLEPDHLDDSIDGAREGGGFARLGVEFNAVGQRTAYHLFRSHPGERYPMSGLGGFGSVPVPARDVMHVYNVDRPGQVRGVPWLAPVLLRLYELDLMDDATLVRQKLANLLAGIGYPDTSGTWAAGRDDGTDAHGQQQFILESGTVALAPKGIAKVEWTDPPEAGSTYVDFVKAQLRAIAAGIGITYEQLSGDLSDVNFSSIRAGLIEFWRLAEQLQWRILIFQLCRPAVLRWLELGVASGALELPEFATNRAKYIPDWRAPRWRWVDPAREVDAEIRAIRAGITSRSEAIAERGGDAVRIDQQIAADNARADELGLVLDSDPRRTANGGTAQSVQPEQNEDEAPATRSRRSSGARR